MPCVPPTSLVANGAGGHPHPRRHRPGILADGVEAWSRCVDNSTPSWSSSSWCARRSRYRAAGADNLAIARDALQAGRAVAIGGAPYLDERPREALDLLAELATECGARTRPARRRNPRRKGVHAAPLVALAERGFPGSIVAGHCVSLGVQPTDVQRRVSEQLAAAGVSVVTLPQTNLYLQGRDPLGPTQRGLPRLRVLLDAGVNVAVGGDNVRDPFNPMGRNDPLESAALAVAAGHLTPTEAYHAASGAARRALGVRPRLASRSGGVADLVLLQTTTVARRRRRRRVGAPRDPSRARGGRDDRSHPLRGQRRATELPREGVMRR